MTSNDFKIIEIRYTLGDSFSVVGRVLYIVADRNLFILLLCLHFCCFVV